MNTAANPPIAGAERLHARLVRERRARREAEAIAEHTTRELYARQQELTLLFAVARAANDGGDVHDVLTQAVTRICAHTGWPVGHVYLADPAVGLRPTDVWHADPPERFAAFRRVTAATPLAHGEGLGGQVLASRKPLWMTDVLADTSFVRARLDVEIGVRAGFAFPLLVGAEVVGVMEFFSGAVEPPDERLLQVMAQIGTELGRALERDRAHAAQQLLNRELNARATELERSNAELAQFASIASHDLQEPLRKVRTFTQSVIDSDSHRLSDEGRDRLRRANNAAARMQSLVEDLLSFSRVSTRGREFEPIDLQQVTADVLDDLETAVRRAGAEVRIGPLPTVQADALQMRQLMQNLLANALKFRREDVPPQIDVAGALDGALVQITVRDNGIGFDARYRDRIFRVFERLHARTEYEGTGIGLALCRKIAERHGGTIAAESTGPVGATFTVTLPLAAAQPSDQPAPTSAASRVSERSSAVPSSVAR